MTTRRSSALSLGANAPMADTCDGGSSATAAVCRITNACRLPAVAVTAAVTAPLLPTATAAEEEGMIFCWEAVSGTKAHAPEGPAAPLRLPEAEEAIARRASSARARRSPSTAAPYCRAIHTSFSIAFPAWPKAAVMGFATVPLRMLRISLSMSRRYALKTDAALALSSPLLLLPLLLTPTAAGEEGNAVRTFGGKSALLLSPCAGMASSSGAHERDDEVVPPPPSGRSDEGVGVPFLSSVSPPPSAEMVACFLRLRLASFSASFALRRSSFSFARASLRAADSAIAGPKIVVTLATREASSLASPSSHSPSFSCSDLFCRERRRTWAACAVHSCCRARTFAVAMTREASCRGVLPAAATAAAGPLPPPCCCCGC